MKCFAVFFRAALICATLFLPGKAFTQTPDQITLLLPAFESEGALGLNVATALNLRIWPTLRRKPWPDNPRNLDFGPGLILWDTRPLAEQTHVEAEKQARDLQVLAQLVLWGKAYHYGGGVVVQANMSLPLYNDFRANRNELWEIVVADQRVNADVPRRRFEIGSIVLRPEIIERYSEPSALKIYASRDEQEPVGVVGSSYRGLQFEPELGWAKVRSSGKTGWVKLPELGKYPTQISSFVAGLIKVYRGDWEQALEAMRKTLAIESIRTPLRIDANLYAGLCLEKLGRSGREYFDTALQLNPYAQRSIRYRAMSELAALRALLQQAAMSDIAREQLLELRAYLEKNQKLFGESDPWLDAMMAALRQLTMQLSFTAKSKYPHLAGR